VKQHFLPDVPFRMQGRKAWGSQVTLNVCVRSSPRFSAVAASVE
jgi:hypothetical protein